MSKIQITPKYADVKPSGYYVYLHYRTSNGLPFYVGKGKDNRGWIAYKRDRSEHWWNISFKNGASIDICQDGMTESDAHILEMWIIAKLRHEGHTLVNLTNGGEGMSGLSPSHETRLRLRDSQGGGLLYCSNGMVFETTMDAVRWLEATTLQPAFSGPISKCARAVSRTAYGHAWSYECTPDVPKFTGEESRRNFIRQSRIRRVICNDSICFISLNDGAEWLRSEGHLKASHSAISHACSSGKNAYGYSWSYV